MLLLLTVHTAFWFYHHKRVRTEFRFICNIFNILRTAGIFMVFKAKKTSYEEKGCTEARKDASKPVKTRVMARTGLILTVLWFLGCRWCDAAALPAVPAEVPVTLRGAGHKS